MSKCSLCRKYRILKNAYLCAECNELIRPGKKQENIGVTRSGVSGARGVSILSCDKKHNYADVQNLPNLDLRLSVASCSIRI